MRLGRHNMPISFCNSLNCSTLAVPNKKLRPSQQKEFYFPKSINAGTLCVTPRLNLYLCEMTAISPYLDQIINICRQNKVKELYAFGSVLTPSYNFESDIDLLVDFQKMTPAVYADNYFKLKFALEEILGRHIDLLEIRSLKNPFLSQEINSKKELLYVA